MTLALSVGVLVAVAQTDFRHLSYKEAIAAAKAENKLVFIDFYTEWCGPCRMMANDVFPQKEVGDFMNERFVSVKIDAEKGEGVELANRYQVKAYPTFIGIDADEKEVMRLVGANSAEGFIAAVTRAIDPEQSPERLRERYAGGERTAELVRAYAALLMDEACENNRGDKAEEARRIVLDYFAGLDEEARLSAENVFIYTEYVKTSTEEAARFMVEHRNDFAPEVREIILKSISHLCDLRIYGYFGGHLPYDDVDYKQVKADVKELGLTGRGHYNIIFNLIETHAGGDLEAYLKQVEKDYDKLDEGEQQTLMLGMDNLFAHADKAVLEHASRFIRSRLEKMDISLLRFISMPLGAIEEKMASGK